MVGTASERSNTIDGIINRVEARIDSVAGRLSTLHNGNGRHSQPEPPLQLGDSLFELVVQQIIQGYHMQLTEHLTQERLQRIIQETVDIVVGLDDQGRVATVNEVFVETFGYDASEVVGNSFLEIIDKEYRTGAELRIRRVSSRHGSLGIATPDDITLFRSAHADGSRLSLECVFCATGGQSLYPVLAVMRDLSLHQSLLEQLQETRDNYDALSETVTEAILRIDEGFQIVFANSATKQTFGYSPEELRGRSFSIIFPPGVFERHKEDVRKYFYVDDQDRARLGLDQSFEFLGTTKNRGVAPMEMSFGNSKEFKGRTLTCIIRDITVRKNAERKLRHLAFHDQLTGLGNRDLFANDVKTCLRTCETTPEIISALMFLDLDGFKQVNDTLGHDAGDKLLVETARRLRSTLREGDTVYRFGGDEFVVLLSRLHYARDAGRVANKLLAAIRRPYLLDSRQADGVAVTVGVSLGIALIPQHGSDVETLTKAADLAMYSAKNNGKNRIEVFNERLNAEAKERWQIEQGLKAAIEQHQMKLVYQPLVDTDGGVRGFEALLRWTHPELGEVPPSRFVPVAEDTGLIVPLGNWVLETACRDVRSWNESGHATTYVSVNISTRQFEQNNLVEVVSGIIERSGVNPANLKLEVTETCIMRSPESAIRTMKKLKQHHPGLAISIDDFGTGYSSLSYLSKLPADSIKIDLSFVSKLFSLNNEKIVNAIINLAHALELDIVAEGVESSSQWEFFRERKCQTMQGFHFQPPVPRESVQGILDGGPLGDRTS